MVGGRAWGGRPGRGAARSGLCLRAHMALSRCGSTQYLSRTFSAMSLSSSACRAQPFSLETQTKNKETMQACS